MAEEKNDAIDNMAETEPVPIDADVVAYFENLTKKNGLSTELLINLCLQDCVTKRRKLKISWE